MKRLGFAILTLVAAVVLVVWLRPVEAKKDGTSDIKALEERFAKAAQAKNVDGIMEVYSDDVFVFDVIPPRQYVGAKAYRKDWTDFLGTFEGSITFDVADLAVTSDGDMGYGHSVQHITGAGKNGKKWDFTVRVTDVYRHANGKWRIVHEHVSVPVDFETAKADLSSKP